ncbi:hypothetical protein GGF32_005800 [Allomyces javanicus]|nr:hypothetical protein GGF32_005800 [Allomyces javanicus]
MAPIAPSTAPSSPANDATPTPSKVLLVYMPGSSALFSPSTRSVSSTPTPTLDALVQSAATGSLVLSDAPQSAVCNANHELAHLLGLDLTPRHDFVTAMHAIHPHLNVHVLAVSPDAHVLASDLTLSSTLLTPSSLTPTRLAALAARHLAPNSGTDVTLVHLPYFAPESLVHVTPPTELAEALPCGGRSAAYFPDPNAPSTSPRRRVYVDRTPPPAALTHADAYRALVNDFLASVATNDPNVLVVLALSWDQANLPPHLADARLAHYASLTRRPAAETDEGEERAKKTARSSSLRTLPLALVYHCPTDLAPDGVEMLDVDAIFQHGSLQSIGAWHFLRGIAAKLGKRHLAQAGVQQQQQRQYVTNTPAQAAA